MTREELCSQIRSLSCGTLATLTGKTKYAELDAIQYELLSAAQKLPFWLIDVCQCWQHALPFLPISSLSKGGKLMPAVSRECIRDTLLIKRRFGKAIPRSIRALYNLGVRNLRSSQLAPHVETKMRPGRYLEQYSLKRTAPEIVIAVRGGLVQEVRSTNPYTQVWIADHDIDHEDEAEEQCLSDAEERGQEPDMHVVY